MTTDRGDSRDSPPYIHPGPTPNSVRASDGRILTAPDGWALLPPGDAALSRRVKEAGGSAEKKGRKVFFRGIWAPAATIDRIRADVEAERLLLLDRHTHILAIRIVAAFFDRDRRPECG